MRARIDCIPCLIRQTLEVTKLATNDKNLHESILRDVIKTTLNLDWHQSQLILACSMFKVVYDRTKVIDPYENIKRQCNDIALSLYPELQRIVQTSKDPLNTAIRLSIAGNIIDYGVGREFDIEKTLERVLKSDFAINHYEKFKEKIQNAEKILILGDNSGEIVFDKLLIEVLGKKQVTYMVRGYPFLNDATIKDAKYVGMNEIAEVVELKTCDEGNGIELEEMDNFFSNFDVIISKGQGNFELFSSRKNIFFMFMIKCKVISEILNAPIDLPVLLYTENEGFI
ncbi:MAG: damage-control phosphatase ARMT1 family protein [Candidatus Njordarchaeales archaeon]